MNSNTETESLEELIDRYRYTIKEFWFDVDGVMTSKEGVLIGDVRNEEKLGYFQRSDGIRSMKFLPCDDNGIPLPNTIEYIAGLENEPILECYRFDTRDGKAVEYLVENGFKVFFISGRNSPCVHKRALALGATPFLGEDDKVKVMEKESNCESKNILFIGDGIQDCGALAKCGVSIAPADACEEAKAAARAQTKAVGGNGVIYEAVSIFLKARDLWPNGQ